ncbi:carboxymuconolactone decarboxylase family protein [Occallatibacter riparius]|uniref:Alkyl hydroperoxide reductase AhpD n=1 Tax=Occallatibacter riparius TaxID=1002689 RepID=A0A9J7BTR5_9BACT|nr:carboxymuconolactone decarboxylase family protein [Occallatibacter riparius]UWZ84310.1 carboxymuconolactone decarboxylase family protein [Occallatibacter riparius]
MTLDALIDTLPTYAKDLKLNYSSLVRNNTELTPQQLWGTVVASAIATRSAALTAAVLQAAPAQLSPQALEAAQAAAAIMGMNNVFYRFHHLAANEKYSTMPARLRMNGLRGHGVEEVDFELWSLAVSAINACGKCVGAHEKVVREKGASEELVLATVRVASVIHAIGAVLDAVHAQAAITAPEPALA